MIRALPIHLEPVPGESFRSYLDRLSASNDVPFATILESVGLIEAGGPVRVPNFGVGMSESHLERFCLSTGLDSKRARGMLLETYSPQAIDLSSFDPKLNKATARLALTQWAYFGGSHYCPHCVQEHSGAWLLKWKLPWSFACLQHGVLLIDRCPSCHRRPGIGYDTQSNGLVRTKSVSRLLHCFNCQPRRAGISRGGPGRLCGHPLSDVSPSDVLAFPETLTAQRTIDRLLGYDGERVGERDVALQLSEVRAACALLLFCAEIDEFSDAPPLAIEAVRHHIETRDALQSTDHAKRNGRPGKFKRIYNVPPPSAALMAAVIPLSVSILSTASDTALMERLAPLIRSAADRTEKKNFSALPRFFHFSSRLDLAFRTLAGRRTFDIDAGVRSNSNRMRGNYAFRPAQVPQLLPEAYFTSDLARLFPLVRSNTIRRFCAIALVKLTGRHSWREAAALLDLPIASSIASICGLVVLLRKTGGYSAFARHLHAVAEAFASFNCKVDFAERRARLQQFTRLPADVWACIQRDANRFPLTSSNWHASTWLWAQLSGGDWQLAPAMLERDNFQHRKLYRGFEKRLSPRLASELRCYGENHFRMPTVAWPELTS